MPQEADDLSFILVLSILDVCRRQGVEVSADVASLIAEWSGEQRSANDSS